MKFISPKTDFAFKKIFGSEGSKDILISFLNAIVYSGNQKIQDLEIIDPYNAPSIASLKDSYLDVKAVLDNQSTVIIEMQVINVQAFEKRVIYNLAKTYGNQLKYGQGYRHLTPVIALTITDFEIFPEIDKPISSWVFKEETQLIDYMDEELKMVFVELPKFNKKLEELETITDKWIYFIKEAPNLQIVPDSMEKITEINHALNIANQANLSEKELDELHHQEVFLEDQRGSVIKAQQDALQEGLQEGKKQGIREEKINFTLRLLQQKLGEIPNNLKTSIQNLSSEKLDDLSLAILNFSSVDDLSGFINN